MSCSLTRAALSASLDGEQPGMSRAEIDEHLASCGRCRAFAVGAESLHRGARVSAADAVPDLTGPIMKAIHDAEPAHVERSHHDDRVVGLRWSLAIVGVVQLAMAVPALVLGDDAGIPAHLARHLGSFAVALAVGLLLVAWRPERARSLLPVVSVLAVCLFGSSVLDVADGSAAIGAELSHVPELIGLLAVWLLARDYAGNVTTSADTLAR
jgi:predicted anti-sigma-YlaC factor YlaD